MTSFGHPQSRHLSVPKYAILINVTLALLKFDTIHHFDVSKRGQFDPFSEMRANSDEKGGLGGIVKGYLTLFTWPMTGKSSCVTSYVDLVNLASSNFGLAEDRLLGHPILFWCPQMTSF